MASLAASFGRGAMTNHWIDIGNSDAILIIGSNAAENHPVSFRWATRAQRAGAKIISVDPRFTRTSAAADLYAPLRPGTDIAFMGGLIHYALERGLVQRDYLVTHTNASFLVDPDYRFDAGLFGKLSGGRYTRDHWGFQRDEAGQLRRDPSLQSPDCVYQRLRRHFARYDLERVSEITGTPADTLRAVARTFCATCRPERAGTLLYAMGATQHTHGTQNVRSYVILQLLLGNIGVAGGGINALRGESNVQGSTDHCLLFHILPGYLKAPRPADTDLASYLARCTPRSADPRSANWWHHYPQYAVSLLKAFWGAHATADNGFAFDYLPRHDGDCSHMSLFEAMGRGRIKGLITLGQNPAVGGPNARAERRAMDQLEWLVAVDLWETETAAFWQRPGAKPADIRTEVFLLPAAASLEKEGSVTNSGRWAQWRYAAVAPPGDAHSDLWILDRLCRALRRRYKKGGVFPEPIRQLAWDYGAGPEPDAHRVAQEINGRFLTRTRLGDKTYGAGQRVPAFSALRDDGTTSCGNWLYAGSYPQAENRMARRRRSAPGTDPLGLQPGWAWCWPVNRRILYNRASCNARGEPYAPRRAVVRYDWSKKRWLGDVPDGGWPPLERPDGTPHPRGRYAFIMRPEGHACLWAPGLADGPVPEHYEPVESPVVNRMSDQQRNPVIRLLRPGEVGRADRYPIVATTYRVSEHWQAGAMTRNLPWLAELVPSAFVEMGPALAHSKSIRTGDPVTVSTPRGAITLPAVVTPRLQPLRLGKRSVHQVGLIWQFGFKGLVTGPSANDLTPHVGDANTMIPELKAFLCDVHKGTPKGAGEGSGGGSARGPGGPALRGDA